MKVLVDTSVWIDYFRDGKSSGKLDLLIDENMVVTNDLILTELIPYLKVKKQNKIISLLSEILKNEMKIDWEQIIDFQTRCLKNGINGIGIPDLIIAQNALQNDCGIFTLDNHFEKIAPIINIKVFK
ncbi:TPA: PIN domain nuclease [Candidatus Delongbacteria bacterium]|nr:MAG: twitching motility protein PilT [Candidatus Margulisbacteria bacterium GWF2_35_9]HAQ60585.1 PIN domain nuclease [Candidatus Delongbacteria bacterium]